MSTLSENLVRRRLELGLDVADIQAELNRRGFGVAYSTVAAWFNGGRRPRDVEHLKALCSALKTSIDEMAGGDPEFAQSDFEAMALVQLRSLSDIQQEAVIALLETMRRTK